MDSRLIKTAQGCEVRVFSGGSGQPLLYLHGVTGLLENDPFIDSLSKHFEVHAPVLPGYQDSTGEEHLDSIFSTALHGFDVMNALGIEKPILVGHCLGGMIAAEMAAIAPNDIERLVLIGALGLWDDASPVPDLFATLPFELPELMFNNAQLGQELLTSGMDFNDAEFLTEFLVGNAKRMGMAGRLLFPIPDRGLSKRLYRIKAPTTLIWGENDRLVPTVYAEHFARAISHAQTRVIADSGHMAPYESTDSVVEGVLAAA